MPEMTLRETLEEKLRKLGRAVVIGIAGVSSLANIAFAEYNYNQKDFVDENEKKAVAVSFSPVEIDSFYWQKWLGIPRKPSISENWIAWTQQDAQEIVDMGIEDNRFTGDIYVKHRQSGIEAKLTTSKSANSPALHGDMIAYCDRKGDMINDPNQTFDIYAGRLSFDGSSIFYDNEVMVTAGLPGNHIDPDINGSYIIWRLGVNQIDDPENTHSWPEIWAYSINEEMMFPVSQDSGAKWEPKISKDGNWAAYAIWQGGRWNEGGAWRAWGYNFDLGIQFPIDTEGPGFRRSVAAHFDTDSDQFIVAYQLDDIVNGGIGVARFKAEQGEIVKNPPENPHNISERYTIEGNMVESLIMDGAPGIGPILAYSEYGNYGGGTEIKGINLRTGSRFDVDTGGGWRFSSDIYIDNATGDAHIIYRHDSYEDPQTNIQTFDLSTTENDATSNLGALVINEVKDKPIPEYCGDPGTDYFESDLNKDCHVDLLDFLVMSQMWLNLDCSYLNDACNGADIDRDFDVDSEDYKQVLAMLGESTDPIDPNFTYVEPPIPDPNIIVDSYIGDYFDQSEIINGSSDPNMTTPHPAVKKKIFTYEIVDKTFGLTSTYEVIIPTEGLENIMKGCNDTYCFIPGDGDLSNGWSHDELDRLVFTSSSEEYDLVGGKKLILSIVSSSKETENRDMIISTPYGDIYKSIEVPLEQTLGKYDINRDGIVNIQDFSRISEYWQGQHPEMNPESGDFNSDGIVDAHDLSLFLFNYLDTEPWYDD